MRKFTDTEIQLCKKIAEKERKEIDEGDWVFRTAISPNKTRLVHGVFYAKDKDGNRDEKSIGILTEEELLGGNDCFPLWQEHDCLEWLMDKGWCIDIYFKWLYPEDLKSDEGIYISRIWQGETWKTHYSEKEGKTPLETLLHAVLAILEEAS